MFSARPVFAARLLLLPQAARTHTATSAGAIRRRSLSRRTMGHASRSLPHVGELANGFARGSVIVHVLSCAPSRFEQDLYNDV